LSTAIRRQRFQLQQKSYEQLRKSYLGYNPNETAMRVYAIHHWRPEELAEQYVDNISYPFKYLSEASYIYLFGMNCPECMEPSLITLRYSCSALPYALTETQWEQVRELILYYKKRALEEHADVEPGVLLPEDFAAFARDLRQLLHIPHRLPIYPRIRLGHPGFQMVNHLLWDILLALGESEMYVTQTAAEQLMSSGLKGFELFPVRVESGGYLIERKRWGKRQLEWRWYEATPLYQMVVWGEGGIPRTEPEGAWWQCARCKNWYHREYRKYHLALDESQWDGSDFFRFLGRGTVYVTERAKEWLERSGLRVWLEFTEPTGGYYDIQGRRRAYAEFMREFFGSEPSEQSEKD